MYIICEAFYTVTKVWITLNLICKKQVKQMYHNNLLHKFNTVCIVLNLWLVFDLYGLFLMSLFIVFLKEFNINPDTLTGRNKYHCICMLFCTFILILLEKKLHCSLYIRKFFNRQREKLAAFIIIPLALCVIYFHKVYERLIAERIVLSWLMFFFIVAIFFVYRAIQRENTRDKMLQMRFNMLEDNYRTLLDAQKEKAALLHDMKHHIATLQAIIEAENQQAALSYVQQIYNKLIKRQNHTWTYNSVLDLVLNGKLEEARQKNIQVEIECDNMSELALKPMDICALFSNILDNAIEANTRQPHEKSGGLACHAKDTNV